MFKPITVLKTVALLFLTLVCSNTFAQTPLQNAWKAFFENKKEDAKALFIKAADQKENAGEAYLGLSLLAHLNNSSDVAFDYFKKFYAQSANPQPYIFGLWTTPSINESFGKKTENQLAFLREIAQKKEYDGTITAMAYSMIGGHYQSSKKAILADKEFANVGSLDNWAISADFQNISTSGFDKTYPTLSHPEDNASFKNKNGVNVSWHTVPFLRHDKWFDFTYYANAYNSVIFAQSFVKCDTEQEAQLRIGVSGSVKVWVNDQLILSEAEERNNDLDTYIQSVKLHQGYNRLLVQIGESYAERSNFLLRLTDKSGHALPNLVSTAKYQPYTKEDKYVSQKQEQFAVAYFNELIKKDANDYLSRLLLANTYLKIDKTFEARNVLEPLLKAYPNSTFLNCMLIELFAKTSNRTGQETAKEIIKMADPESSIALTLKYNEFYDQKEYDKAAEVIKKIETLYPFNSEFIYGAKIDLADNNNDQNGLIKITEEAYNKFPDNRNFMKVKYQNETNIRKDAPKGIEVLKKFLANNDSYSTAKDLAEAYFTIGKPAVGLKVYMDEIAFDPIGIALYSKMGDQYYTQQMYTKAEESYLNCIKISSTNSEYYTSLAKVYEATNQKEKAIQFYQKGLQLDPSDYSTIKSLRKLQGKKAVFNYFEEPDISASVKTAPKASDFPDYNYIILNQEVQKVVYENGGSEDRRYVVIKALNQKGIEALKEYSISTNNDQNLLIEVAEVIKANGNKIPAEKNENNLVFTNLEIGDVISIRYKTENYYKGDMASHFWDSFYFLQGCPAVNLKYSLLIHKNKSFNYKLTGQNIEPEKKSADEFDMYVWKATNVKAISIEDKMPAFADVSNVLYLTSIPNWKFISDWYNDMASAKARTNYEVKSIITDLFKGKESFTEMQKIEAIYNYITGNISYSSVSFRQSGLIPQNPADVINTRIGDCKDVATLFVAMCKEAGIKAQLVLVKTRNYGLKNMALPNIEFNHCIAKVNVNSHEYYIELTSKYLPFRALYKQYLNSSILDIGNANTSSTIKYLDPSTRKANDVNRITNISFKDKDLIINEKIYETGGMAAMIRGFYKDMSPSDQIKKTKEAFSNMFPDNDVNRISFTNLNEVTLDTVHINIDFEVKNSVKEIAGMYIFSLPWSDKFSAANFQIVLPRNNGIDLSQLFSMDNETETITINLPAGKAIIESPVTVNLTNDVMDYSITPKVEKDKLILTRVMKIKQGFIPTEKVAEFNAFFKKVVEADNKELALK
jgi:hypothetical protein